MILAAAIPKIDLFISLVGAFGSTFLVICFLYVSKVLLFYQIILLKALIFPPILEYITFAPNISRITVAKEILILLFGIIGFGTGTYAAILAIVQSFQEE